MPNIEDPEPREPAKTPFEGAGPRGEEPMVSGGLLEGVHDDAEAEPGVRFVAPPAPGSQVGSGGPGMPGFRESDDDDTT